MIIFCLNYEFEYMKLNFHLFPRVLLLYRVCLNANKKKDKVNITQIKKAMILTYITWSKKESSYISKINLQVQKMKLQQLSLS